jgi:5-methylcytosine-specific restriction endonuclease McrA
MGVLAHPHYQASGKAMLKRCSKCGLEKNITNFCHARAKKDGYHGWCKNCLSKYQKEYYKENKKKIRECVRAYQQTEKGKTMNACAKKKYYQTPNGKTALACGQKKYFQTPKGKIAMKRVMHRRNAQKKNTEATLTSDQWQLILKKQTNRCNMCKQKFTKKRVATVDHIIPVSKGGGLTFENAQALCRSCNSSKNAKLYLGFIQTWAHRQ